MRRHLIVVAVVFTAQGQPLGQTDQSISDLLKVHQYDLASEGKALLEKEARAASFFLIGGLHGDKETPALVASLWPTVGYSYLTMEMSPWAASRLGMTHVRGSDIEEPQPHSLIRELAQINPSNQALQSMVELTKDGYKRPLALKLFALAASMGEIKDTAISARTIRRLRCSPRPRATLRRFSTCGRSDVPFTRSHRKNFRRLIQVCSIGPIRTMRWCATAR